MVPAYQPCWRCLRCDARIFSLDVGVELAGTSASVGNDNMAGRLLLSPFLVDGHSGSCRVPPALDLALSLAPPLS
jgi:hypothetical protein